MTDPKTSQTTASPPGLETFEEWRVTGDPGHGFPQYDFVWSPDRNPHLGDPEIAARTFLAPSPGWSWDDGPHLHRRTVTRTGWESMPI